MQPTTNTSKEPAMAAVNPLWNGHPLAELGRVLIALNPETAKAEVDRIMDEVREETYRQVDAQFNGDRNSVTYDDAFDAAYRDAIIARTELLRART